MEYDLCFISKMKVRIKRAIKPVIFDRYKNVTCFHQMDRQSSCECQCLYELWPTLLSHFVLHEMCPRLLQAGKKISKS